MAHTAPALQVKTVALIGNPNCGKTTLFNALTGSRYKVANYPGVTVEKKEGLLHLPHGAPIRLIDLPGTYALEGTSVEERIVTAIIKGEISDCPTPDLMVAVVDATNLERNLFIVSELIDAGFRIIVAVNMVDSATKEGIKIYTELLARNLDAPVVAISARERIGLTTLVEAIASALLLESRSTQRYGWMTGHIPAADSNRQTSDIAELGALRYKWIKEVVNRSTSREQDVASGPHVSKLDRVLTSKMFGIPILILIFGFIFQSIFLWAQLPMELISTAVEELSALASRSFPPGMLTELLAEGVIPGVGNVIVFVPQIAVLFLCIGFLEDSGYLSRAAFLLDSLMRRVGLQGRAFIPLLSSFACAIPGILATRTIPSHADRLATIMIAPLMSCSARLPVYAVLIGAFIPPVLIGGLLSLQGLVLLLMYLLGVLGACGMAWILKRTLLRQDPSFLVMEMPPLRCPVFAVVFRNTYDSVVSFLKNASTVILACSVIVWFLASYPKPPPSFEGNRVQASYAGQIGTAIEPLIKPLGFDWEIGIGIISSFPAREVFISTLATIYNIDQNSDGEESLIQNLQERRAGGTFSTITAISLMVFYVFACQCMSTLAVCRRETGSWGWTLGMFISMTVMAYLASFFTYQLGSRLL